MKKDSLSSSALRRILIGMVTDTTVANRIASKWNREGLFDSTYANLVGGWAVRYVLKYGTAIGKHIEVAFERWATNRKDGDELVRSVGDFLEFLSGEYERESPESSAYILDLAAKYIDAAKIRAEILEAESDLDADQIDAAYARLHNLGRVELGNGSLLRPADDFTVWRQAWDEEQDPLFRYPGTLGKLVDRAIVREGFLGVMASDKVGKSFFLLDMAVRGLKARRRVAYFEVGDLGQTETLLRLGKRATGKPVGERVIVQWPVKGVWSGPEQPPTDERVLEPLTPQAAYKAVQRLTQGKDRFRLSCHPNTSINVSGIESIVSGWEREGWVPDLLIIDYADILSPPTGVKETIDQVDIQWRHLRRLSQRWHCLTVTATQANAKAYESEGSKPLRRKNFSGNKKKLAHVTGMLGLSRDLENSSSVTHVAWIVGRSWSWREGKAVPVAGCLETACTILRPYEGGDEGEL